MAKLEKRYEERLREVRGTLDSEALRDWCLDNAPSPRAIPPMVVEAEIAPPGSTNIRVELNQRGEVITAIPGGRK